MMPDPFARPHDYCTSRAIDTIPAERTRHATADARLDGAARDVQHSYLILFAASDVTFRPEVVPPTVHIAVAPRLGLFARERLLNHSRLFITVHTFSGLPSENVPLDSFFPILRRSLAPASLRFRPLLESPLSRMYAQACVPDGTVWQGERGGLCRSQLAVAALAVLSAKQCEPDGIRRVLSPQHADSLQYDSSIAHTNSGMCCFTYSI